MTEQETLAEISKFIEQREWSQFHTLDNLAKSICIEAAELLELFQWATSEDLDRVKDELADVLTYCYLLAIKVESNPSDLILKKLAETELKYPIEKSKGRSTKYDRL